MSHHLRIWIKNYAFMHDMIKHVHFLLILYSCKMASGPRKWDSPSGHGHLISPTMPRIDLTGVNWLHCHQLGATHVKKWIHLQKGLLKLLLFRDVLTKTLNIWMTNQTNMCLTFMSSHLFNGVYHLIMVPHVTCCESLSKKYYTKFGVSSHIASFLIKNTWIWNFTAYQL